METAKVTDATDPSEVNVSDFSYSNIPVFWNRESTDALLNAYEMFEDRVGTEFRTLKFLWTAVSLEIKKQIGKYYTPHQCENRWRVLQRTYKKVLNNDLNSTTRRRKDFPYFDVMQRLMKGTKNSEPASQKSESGVSASAEKSNVHMGDICIEPEQAPSSSKQLFIISGNQSVNSDTNSGAPSNSQQLFLIRAKPITNNGSVEPDAPPSCAKQLFIRSGKTNVNSSEADSALSSSKQFFIISGKSNVNNDGVCSEPEPTPSSNEHEPAATKRKQLFISPSKSSITPQDKKRKAKQSFLEQIRADRKLYFEKKLEADRERLERLERRNDELLQLKKTKLQQTERLVACEEEKLKYEKEKLAVSREKLKMLGALIQLQEDSNDILRSINEHLDFLV